MVEARPRLNDIDCLQYAHLEHHGQIMMRNMMFMRDGKVYTISVTTPGYLERLIIENRGLEPDLRADLNAFVLDDISDPGEICGKLSQTPFSNLLPFITEQEDSK